ncbi:hypothetical protein BU23DRAFT_638295 [Bimuria novae-zelandiae CBS 107.79]|uniref:Uncharacterized protein n=1 Tax=Bimuria novae-zelandiae CBS 107.79 TaxID=1447943 RepID=A0A6A5VGJ7_9PLEO|nr:hypothetical protein BU23DRAFT_638295 [Bimuria novae-zelandiae CBS 107.79]
MPTATTMPELLISIDDRIAEILDSISDIPKPNFSKLAREHGTPNRDTYQRLLARSKGRPTLSQRPPTMCKLTQAQDSALYDYIACLDELGVCVPIANDCIMRQLPSSTWP